MTENKKYVKEARHKVEEFETQMEPERLREASIALENVILAKENDTETRYRLRKECLYLWLNILQLIDKHLDPSFNPDEGFVMGVQPPPTSEGVVYPPGVDPAKIDDPKARAEYVKAIAENKKKQENYRLQIQLGRLNEQIPQNAKDFIRNSFKDSPEDKKEVRTAIEEKIESPGRKADLLELLESSPPVQ